MKKEKKERKKRKEVLAQRELGYRDGHWRFLVED